MKIVKNLSGFFGQPEDILEFIMLKKKYKLESVKIDQNKIYKVYKKGKKEWKISYPLTKKM